MCGSIGPANSLTFGIDMEKKLKEPILIIKTAWGGQQCRIDVPARPARGNTSCPRRFRMRKPSQGAHGVPKLEERKKWQDDKDTASGVFYRMMVEHVKKVPPIRSGSIRTMIDPGA